jgi:hypothetical protein
MEMLFELCLLIACILLIILISILLLTIVLAGLMICTKKGRRMIINIGLARFGYRLRK